MTAKIGRNDPCPCGSGKKFKKCCVTRPSSHEPAESYSWMAHDGMHVVAPSGPLIPEKLEQMTQTYQKQIRKSPMWKNMVQEFGKEKAEALLKECQVKPG